MAKNLLNRYIWLVDTIYQAGRITFDDINAKWQRSIMNDGETIPSRTFHNHRKAIEELFDINIECDKRDGYRYYIENAEDIEHGGVRTWLLNTFAVNNLINESHKIKSRILFEEIPSGQQFLTPIIEAMRGGLALEMTYQSYWNDRESTYLLHPYCVKIFKQRWYLAAYSPEKDRLHIYALDRINDLNVSDKKFKLPKKFSSEDFFHDSFGIIVDNDIPVEKVEIKVFGNQVKYIRSLPLHHSQQEVDSTTDYTVFSYYVKPTFDFQQELLSQGPSIEVLQPKWLRSEIKNKIKGMNNHYK